MTARFAALAAATALVQPGVILMATETIEELQAELAELAEEATRLLNLADTEERDLTDQENTSISEAAERAEKIKAKIAVKKRVADLNAAPPGPGRRTTADGPGEGNGTRRPPASARNSRTMGFAHLGEFAATIRGAAMRQEEALNRLMAMGEGGGEDGGHLVPPEFREDIMKVVEGEDSLLSRTDGSTTSRNAVTHPKDETTPWGTAGIVAYWEGEAQAATAAGAKFQGDTLRLNKLFARVDVTDELLEDAPQLDNYLRVKAPEVMTSVINLAIIQGNGVGKPLGFMNSSALVTVSKETSQPADTVHHRNIVKMWSRMYAPCRRNAIWLINQDVEPQLDLMSFRDNTTSPVPIYLPAGTIAGVGYATLKGRPVIPLQGMETLGDLGDIALIDPTKYRSLTKTGGARVDTSIHLKFNTDETVFRFIFRLAGAPWWSAPISPRDGSNTLSPFVTLESR